jgi:hypothetical protein
MQQAAEMRFERRRLFRHCALFSFSFLHCLSPAHQNGDLTGLQSLQAHPPAPSWLQARSVSY